MAATPSRIKLPLVGQNDKVSSLLLWDKPRDTAIVFGGLTAAFLLLQFGSYNLFSIVAFMLSAVVFGALIWQYIGGFVKKPFPPLPRILVEGVPDAQVRAYADRAAPLINQGLRFASKVLGGRDPVTSIAVGTGLFVAGKLVACVPVLVLAYLPILAAFVLPKVYELKKDEIDHGLTIGREKATAVHDKYLASILAKIPRAQGAAPAESSSMRKTE